MKKNIMESIDKALSPLCGQDGVRWTYDVNDNAFAWVTPGSPDTLRDIAQVLAGLQARLLTITAYRRDKFGRVNGREIAYHFDVDGVVATVTVVLDDEFPRVPSVAPWFKNAGWNEREFTELYGIEVIDHPNPARLFIDRELDADILDRLIPLSTLMNGASTTTLWEKVFAGKQMPDWARGELN